MKSILIVNADDFGLTEGTNQAIIDAHERGIVTSTSLLANANAFDHAVGLAHQHPSLGVGVHLTLTEGFPIALDTDHVLTTNGKLPFSNQPFVWQLLRGNLPRKAIRREFESQIDKIISAGIKPTHIDGHKHIHLLPGITQIVVDVARQFNVLFVRIPHRLADAPTRPGRLPGLLVIGCLGTLAYRAAAGLQTADRMMGFVDTGHLNHIAIRRLLGRPLPGITELLCHPAYRTPQLQALRDTGYEWISGYDFDAETSAVSDPAIRREVEANGWQLRSFRLESKL